MIQNLKAKATEQHDGERFDTVAAALFPTLSRKKVKTVIDAGGAYLNKKRVKVAKAEVRSGDTLELFWEGRDDIAKVADPRTKFERPQASVALRDEHVLMVTEDFVVLSKPAGLPSQATLVSSTDTVLHALAALRPADFPIESLFLVHRLDKETSGVMIVARTREAQKHFEDAFRERRVHKEYHALCFGAPAPAAGTVAFALTKDARRPNTYVAVMGGRSRPGAKEALTRYETLRRFPKAQASLVVCRPETGRTHQIRVHMQAVGCPLLGDKTYAQNIVGHAFAQVALRHMLHAHALEFVGPRGDRYTPIASYPADFAACLAELELRESR